MSLLVADVGGTKSAWYYRPSCKEGLKSCVLDGYHPLWEDSKKLSDELLPKVWEELSISGTVEVSYFGTGIINEAAAAQVQLTLLSYPAVEQATVASDIEAACIAASHGKQGIVCILGTGANSAVYDGQAITDKIPSMGIIIGDEGSGGGLGKMILQAWAYRSLDDDLCTLLAHYTGQDLKGYRQAFLESKAPGQFLAKLAPFALQNAANPLVKQLIYDNFKSFVEKILLKYPSIRSCPIHFVGSFAWFFQEHLRAVLSLYDIQVGVILESPGQKLYDILEKIKFKI
jgi:glucosamine kinase